MALNDLKQNEPFLDPFEKKVISTNYVRSKRWGVENPVKKIDNSLITTSISIKKRDFSTVDLKFDWLMVKGKPSKLTELENFQTKKSSFSHNVCLNQKVPKADEQNLEKFKYLFTRKKGVEALEKKLVPIILSKESRIYFNNFLSVLQDQEIVYDNTNKIKHMVSTSTARNEKPSKIDKKINYGKFQETIDSLVENPCLQTLTPFI